jgi:hypothetical protein
MLVPTRRWSTLLWFTLVTPSIPPVVTKWSPNWLSQWQRLVADGKCWRRTRGEGANHGEGEDEKGDAAGMTPLPWNPYGALLPDPTSPDAAGGFSFAAAPCRGMSRSTRIIPKLCGQWWFVRVSVTASSMVGVRRRDDTSDFSWRHPESWLISQHFLI